MEAQRTCCMCWRVVRHVFLYFAQNATLQTATNGQLPLSTATDTVQLKCNYCRGAFSLKPETLEWEVRPPFLFKQVAKMHNG